MKTDNLATLLIGGSLILLALLAGISFFAFSTAVAVSATAGGVIAIINLLWQRRTLGSLLTLTPAERPVASAMVRFLIRISLTALALYLIITSRWFSVWGLLAGLSVTVFCLFGLTLYVAIQTKENES